jgi:hypothetical protein
MVLVVIAFVAALPAFSTTIYVSGSDANLYTIDPTSGVTTLIGSTGVAMADIGILNGILYGVSFEADSALYTIDPNTGAATKIGPSGFFLNSLQGASNGTLYAAGGPADCGVPPFPPCNQFFTVNTTTGAATEVGSPGTYSASGDLEFIGSTLYLTSQLAATDFLYTIDPTTGVASSIGDISFAEVFGLAYVPGTGTGTLYGFNDDGNNVIAINPLTGAGNKVANYTNNFEIYGAAVSPVPEPGGAVVVLGLGMLFALIVRYYRSNRNKGRHPAALPLDTATLRDHNGLA